MAESRQQREEATLRIPEPGEQHILQQRDASFYAPWLMDGCTKLATCLTAKSFTGVHQFIDQGLDETLEGNLAKLVETLSPTEQAQFRISCAICLHVLSLGESGRRNAVAITFLLLLCSHLRASETLPTLCELVKDGRLRPWGHGVEDLAKEVIRDLS